MVDEIELVARIRKYPRGTPTWHRIARPALLAVLRRLKNGEEMDNVPKRHSKVERRAQKLAAAVAAPAAGGSSNGESNGGDRRF